VVRRWRGLGFSGKAPGAATQALSGRRGTCFRADDGDKAGRQRISRLAAARRGHGPRAIVAGGAPSRPPQRDAVRHSKLIAAYLQSYHSGTPYSIVSMCMSTTTYTTI